ncbi:uncharacterized protein SETTUDRAFT_32149 [Exserohilum turcica Et28A]|uniref:Uncharacterized protein n=1 Tax=Exserohilum turcicum (strain 28A) TaxID=671987 RepID=R0JV55_EXST2|nr:uncharacterized protein SETTUDRAFT_32149 [Exserohilum turcica Et28A]EOA84908.1 hypothetical protein SETTUDRAFT_32149 [Exserohilum turcica Et28A]
MGNLDADISICPLPSALTLGLAVHVASCTSASASASPASPSTSSSAAAAAAAAPPAPPATPPLPGISARVAAVASCHQPCLHPHGQGRVSVASPEPGASAEPTTLPGRFHGIHHQSVAVSRCRRTPCPCG